MLDILSALSSLPFLSSKSLVSFFEGPIVAAQISVLVVVSGFNFKSVVLPYNMVTRTTAAVLSPTRCALSNGSLVSPFSFFSGYFIIILVSLVCTLRAKGFTTKRTSGSPPQNIPSRSRNSVAEDPPVRTGGDGPPPVSPESATGSLNTPRRASWMLFLLILLGLVLALLLGYCYAKVYQVIPLSIFLEGLQLTESTISALVHYASTIQTYICTTGIHYLVVFLFAAVAYLAVIILNRAVSMCSLVASRVSGFDIFFVLCFNLAVFTYLMTPAFESDEIIRLIRGFINFQMSHTLVKARARVFGCFPSADRWYSLSMAERVAILGPAIVQALMGTLWATTPLILSKSIEIAWIPLQILHSLYIEPPRLNKLMALLLLFTSTLHIAFYATQTPKFKRKFWQYPWQGFEEITRCVFADQISNWRRFIHYGLYAILWVQSLFQNAFNFLLKLWRTKCCVHGGFCVHKLLIVLPAVTYYSYFYIIPAAIRHAKFFNKWFRLWRRRRHRRRLR